MPIRQFDILSDGGGGKKFRDPGSRDFAIPVRRLRDLAPASGISGLRDPDKTGGAEKLENAAFLIIMQRFSFLRG